MLLYVDAQFASPYAMSVFVGLHEKNLSFDIQTVDLSTGANHDPQYAFASLTHRIPTLIHEEFALSESSAITEYMDDVFPGSPLYPVEAREKARARQIQAWLRSDLMPIRQERSTEVIFYRQVHQPLSVAGRHAAEKLFDAATALLASRKESLFDSWSIVDVDLALMLNRLVFNGDAVPQKLAEYARSQWERPSVQLWTNHPRPPL